MFVLIVTSLMVLIGIGCIVYAVRAKEGGWIAGLIGGGLIVLAGIWLLAASTAIVQTRNVGIEVAYGKPTGHLSNGFHLKPPYATVTEWDEAIQTTSFLSRPGSHCLQVRIGFQQNACAEVSIQWRVRPSAVDNLFKNYGTFGYMTQALVVREMEQATTQQLADYSPISELQAGNKAGSQLVQIGKQIGSQMRNEIGGQIEVTKVLMLPLIYDHATTARLAGLQQKIVDLANAKEQVQINAQLALANEKLAASVSKDPNVIAYTCTINVLEPLVKDGISPAGVVCPGSGGGGSSTVVIPAGR